MSERKPRNDSRLKTLPAERQEQIAEYAREHSLSATAAWLKEDGVVTSSAALSEFLSWYYLRKQFAAFEKNSLTMIELLRQKRPELPESELEGYAAEFFQLQALQQSDPETFLAFSTAKARAALEKEKIRIKQETLELQRAKFQRDTAELFLRWFEDRQAREVATSGATNAEKIERLGQLMFGEDWTPPTS